jgi:hypothetical protein
MFSAAAVQARRGDMAQETRAGPPAFVPRCWVHSRRIFDEFQALDRRGRCTALMASPALAEDNGGGAAGGAVAGAATGAAAGAVVGGPVGAAVGGVVGAAAGGTAGAAAEPPPPVREYVIQQDEPSVVVEGPVEVGTELPQTVELYPIPKYDTYEYAVVNHERVIVDHRTGRVVQVIKQEGPSDDD